MTHRTFLSVCCPTVAARTLCTRSGLGLALFLVATAGCASGTGIEQLPEASALRASDPAAFVVALIVPAFAEDVQLDARLADTVLASPEALRDRLILNLRELRAASVITAIDGDPFVAADKVGADIVLRPRLREAQFTHAGGTRNGVLSSLLWLTTWVGGLFVADSDYETKVTMDWDLVNPHTGQVIATFVGSSRTFELGFLQRHDFFSVGTLQTLVLPPVLSADNQASTWDSLASAGVAHAAADLTRHLKSRFAGEERELLGELKLETPRNGETVRGECRLRGALIANEPISELLVSVGGKMIVELDPVALPPLTSQRVGARTYRVPLPDLLLPLEVGENRVVIYYIAGGRRSSRTLLLHHMKDGGGS